MVFESSAKIICPCNTSANIRLQSMYAPALLSCLPWSSSNDSLCDARWALYNISYFLSSKCLDSEAMMTCDGQSYGLIIKEVHISIALFYTLEMVVLIQCVVRTLKKLPTLAKAVNTTVQQRGWGTLSPAWATRRWRGCSLLPWGVTCLKATWSRALANFFKRQNVSQTKWLQVKHVF